MILSRANDNKTLVDDFVELCADKEMLEFIATDACLEKELFISNQLGASISSIEPAAQQLVAISHFYAKIMFYYDCRSSG